MNRLFLAACVALSLCAPAYAASEKPLVIKSGHTQQLPAGDTLDLTASPLATNISGATQCVQADSAGVLSGTGSACGGGGSGTVTSVGVASPGATLSVSGSPVTGSGTINLDVVKLGTARTFSYTGDATGGPTSFDGSANVSTALTLANSGVTAGSYTCLDGTVDAKGRLTAASSGTCGGGASPGGTSGQIQYNNAGTFGGFTMSGDVTVNTGTGAATLANSGVSAGSYTCANVTFDAKGRATTAANGTCSGGGAGISGTPTAGDCASWFNSTTLQDAGAACGTAGGSSYGSGVFVSLGSKGAATSGNTASSYQTMILAETSLVAYWKLNDAVGSTTAADSKGTNNATVTLPYAFGFPGRIGSTCAFNPVADGEQNGPLSISLPASGDFTIEAWVMPSAGNTTGTIWYQGNVIFGRDVAGTTNDYALALTSGGRAMGGTGNPDTTYLTANSLNTLDGRWHHLVMTRVQSTGAVAVYVDGVSAATGTGGTQLLNASTTMFMHSFVGFLADVAVYNTALSSTTIQAHYNAGKP